MIGRIVTELLNIFLFYDSHIIIFLKPAGEAGLEIVCVGDNMTFQYTLKFWNKRDDKTR